jgi:hypothetical protein
MLRLRCRHVLAGRRDCLQALPGWLLVEQGGNDVHGVRRWALRRQWQMLGLPGGQSQPPWQRCLRALRAWALRAKRWVAVVHSMPTDDVRRERWRRALQQVQRRQDVGWSGRGLR